MKKILTLALLAIAATGFAQTGSDTTKPVPPAPDTAAKTFVLVGNEPSFNYLLTVLSQSKLQANGEALSFAQAAELIRWIQAARQVTPENGKTPPKK